MDRLGCCFDSSEFGPFPSVLVSRTSSLERNARPPHTKCCAPSSEPFRSCQEVGRKASGPRLAAFTYTESHPLFPRYPSVHASMGCPVLQKAIAGTDATILARVSCLERSAAYVSRHNHGGSSRHASSVGFSLCAGGHRWWHHLQHL